jgi:hypothetical protein
MSGIFGIGYGVRFRHLLSPQSHEDVLVKLARIFYQAFTAPVRVINREQQRQDTIAVYIFGNGY